MELDQDGSLYEVLDIKPDASPQEVREAYLRAKAAYGKDSIALYTLISADEREEMLTRIEEAYDVLSSTDRRKEYDRRHGLLDFDEEANTPARVPHNQKIISIDRVPPMESSRDSESMLVAPSTDFTAGSGIAIPAPPAGGTLSVLPGGASSAGDSPFELAPATDADTPPRIPASSNPAPTQVAVTAQNAPPPPASALQLSSERARAHARQVESALSQEIAQEIEWRGQFLRKVREARRISIEEMSSITKVSKTYILSIEEENFPKLPAPVFMRGFVAQMAKVLRLPHEQVAAAYMARYYQARPDSKPGK
jgi:hypothetical protein